ncbi:MAG TPA: hypothetical protein VGG33_09145 [Polyangia bacterium]
MALHSRRKPRLDLSAHQGKANVGQRLDREPAFRQVCLRELDDI